jgi:DNA-binding response OmpR family regulator
VVVASRAFILLVEDDLDHAELILRVFRKHNVGNEVVVVHDGEQALDFLFARGSYAGREAADLPQVVILDLKLPKLNGLEVLKRLRAETATRFLPVVMLTTSNEERDIFESYKLGANSYVRKPVNFQAFNDAIRDLGLYWLLRNEVAGEESG